MVTCSYLTTHSILTYTATHNKHTWICIKQSALRHFWPTHAFHQGILNMACKIYATLHTPVAMMSSYDHAYPLSVFILGHSTINTILRHCYCCTTNLQLYIDQSAFLSRWNHNRMQSYYIIHLQHFYSTSFNHEHHKGLYPSLIIQISMQFTHHCIYVQSHGLCSPWHPRFWPHSIHPYNKTSILSLLLPLTNPFYNPYTSKTASL